MVQHGLRLVESEDADPEMWRNHVYRGPTINYRWVLDRLEGRCSNPWVAQGSTVLHRLLRDRFFLCWPVSVLVCNQESWVVCLWPAGKVSTAWYILNIIDPNYFANNSSVWPLLKTSDITAVMLRDLSRPSILLNREITCFLYNLLKPVLNLYILKTYSPWHPVVVLVILSRCYSLMHHQ